MTCYSVELHLPWILNASLTAMQFFDPLTTVDDKSV